MLVKKKHLIIFVSAVFIFLSALVIPHTRAVLVDHLSLPLSIFSYLNKEIQALIFYHQNFKENQRLEKELGLFKRQVHEIQELYLENARLRQLLDFKEKSVFALTAADVIGYDPSNLTSSIIINKGKRHNIDKGYAVISNQGLVGRLVEVGERTAKILLIDDINSGVAVFIQRTRQQGLLKGTLSRRLFLQYLPENPDIQPGDFIITSGLSGIFPKGIRVGKVVAVHEAEIQGEVYVIVEPSADLRHLEEVLIVLPGSEE